MSRIRRERGPDGDGVARIAAIVISEVDPYGSNGTDGYSADWFELTNTGTTAVSIAGDTMIDSHAWSGSGTTTNPYSSGTIRWATPPRRRRRCRLRGVRPASRRGQSVIFLESSSTAANSGTFDRQFRIRLVWQQGADQSGGRRLRR